MASESGSTEPSLAPTPVPLVLPEGALRAALQDRYALEGEVAHGAMGTVLRARDLRHDRIVALKILRPELAGSVASDRFAREVHAAARLVHPNIVTVHDSGEAAGLLYYVMPFVEGESLRDRLTREHALPVPEALRIAAEVAEALAFAHAHGIVHRDIKPANILLGTHGHALVTDFGIARALSETAQAQLTGTGGLVGSPVYLSPEQAAGGEVDGRADVYSLGCVLYEMLCARPPFERATLLALLSAHMTDEPTHPTTLCPGLPAEVEQAVLRMLRKFPGERPSAAELAAELTALAPAREAVAALSDEAGASPHRRRRALLIGGAVGLVLLLALVAVAAHFTRAPRSEGPITSAAVLPFSNISGDPRNEYLSDGVTEELLNELTKVQTLRVAGRTSSFYFKGKDLPPGEVARRLNVGAIVEGSVQRVGERIRITAQLVDARTGYQLWSDHYDRDVRDLFAIEDDIARAVVSALEVHLAGGTTPRRHTPDAATHDLYLRARYLLDGVSRSELERSAALFEQAIARDSDFAQAYAGAATAWVHLADAYVPPLQAYPKAELLAQRGLALDSMSAEAHAALAYTRMVLRWDWAGAGQEFQRALGLNPNDALTHASYADYLDMRGGPGQALPELKEAVRLDPFSPYFIDMLGWCWLRLGQVDSASALFRRAEEISPGHVYTGSLGSAILRAQGRYADALPLDRAASRARGVPTAGLVESLVGLGRHAEAEAVFREILSQSSHQYIMPEVIASAALALGHREQALDWLARGVAGHSGGARLRYGYPQLRRDPRYQGLLRRMGLDTLST